MTKLSHEQARAFVEQAADGVLDATKQQSLSMHLADCSACAAYAAELNSLEQELSESLKEHWGDPQPNPGSAAALARQLSQIAKGGGGG
ncbi:MAG TPA: hypothetical protein VF982_01710, partial [Anaerolineales bacterium]